MRRPRRASRADLKRTAGWLAIGAAALLPASSPAYYNMGLFKAVRSSIASNLLLKGEGTNGSQSIYDSSGHNESLTIGGNVQVSTAQSKFGSGSLYFDGTGDWLSKTGDANLNPGAGDFTVEMWIRPAVLTIWTALADFRSSATGPALGLTSAGQIYLEINGSYVITDAASMTANTWYHIALVRSGSTITLYKNGTSVGTTTSSANFNGNALSIGTYYSTQDTASTYKYTGYIDNYRLVAGTAVYTSNFTPPGDF